MYDADAGGVNVCCMVLVLVLLMVVIWCWYCITSGLMVLELVELIVAV